MKTVFAAFAASVLIIGAAHAAPPNQSDARALKKFGTDNDASWDAGDAQAISSRYAVDGTLRLGDSEIIEGRNAVRAHFQRAFANRPAGLHHVSHVERIDMVRSDLALAEAHVRVERANPDGSRTILREFHNVSLIARKNDAWRFRAIYAQPLPPRSAAPAPTLGR